MSVSSIIKVRLNNLEQYVDSGIKANNEGRFDAAKDLLNQAHSEALNLARLSKNTDLKAKYLSEANKIKNVLDSIAVKKTEPLEPRLPTKDSADKDTANALFTPIKSMINFSDVVGMEKVKQELLQRMKLPFEHAEQAKRWGVSTGGGILLYGPPGTGKTFIASAAAGELDAAFIPAKASDLMSQWVGKSEKNIAALFESAREHERCIIFIDELEALIPKRGKNQSTIMARVVPQFLAETDGVEGKRGNILIMGATNCPWMIDDAMLRGGRLDALIYIGLPDIDSRKALLARYLQSKPMDDDVDFDKLAELSEGLSAADIKSWSDTIAREGFSQSLENANYQLSAFALESDLTTMRRSVSEASLLPFKQFEKD